MKLFGDFIPSIKFATCRRTISRLELIVVVQQPKCIEICETPLSAVKQKSAMKVKVGEEYMNHMSGSK